MKHFFFSLILFLLLFSGCKSTSPSTTTSTGSNNSTSTPDTRFYEMRVYYSPPGKLADLNTRFRNHTTKLFEKHGMTNIGYWEPIENPENKLIYILAYPSKEARDASWKAFGADPEWQTAAKASEVNGKLVAKVDSWYLVAADYSPVIQPSSKQSRVFELRTYTASPNNIENLHARFRDHTVNLFQKHGMTNVGYWRPADKESDKKDMLVYVLAHASKEAGEAAFKAFGQDPEWVKARQASEVKGGGSLTAKVESVYMRATDYSPIK